MTYVPLSYRADEIGAHIACFGHSHIAGAFEESGVIYINPGSIRLPRNRKEGTYCICERTSSDTTVTFYEQSGEVVNELTEHFYIK